MALAVTVRAWLWGLAAALPPLVLCGVATAAQPLQEQPLLRIDPGAHTALIRKAELDARTQRLYTVSDDKTVRVWQMPSGAQETDSPARLLATWRVPANAGNEGQLFALALSPDGREVAVAGWTCWDTEQMSCVYVFDAHSGELARRIRVAPYSVTGMQWSPDGRHLAVGLHGLGGLVVLDMRSARVVATDGQYQGKLMNLQFDRHGRLVTAALDGFVRYYRADFSLMARRAVSGGASPSVLRISPDGNLIAVGFLDRPRVALLNADDLSPLRELDAGRSRVTNTLALGWSDDGRFLYVSGEPRHKAAAMPILRYATRSWSEPQLIAGPAQRINDFMPLGAGRMLFVSEDPSIGWIDAAARRHLLSGSAQLDFSQAQNDLWVSARGDQVAFALSRRAGDRAVFRVHDARLAAAAGTAAMLPPQRNAPALSVVVDAAERVARVNGRAVPLDEAEIPRAHALSHDGSTAYIGSEWALRAVDEFGVPRWRVNLPSVVWAVNAAADGRHVVALLSDGTVRWYRADTGAEVLALFVHGNREDWIAWTPDGHYASSPFGDRHVGWHVNRGPDTAPDFFRAVQLERVLHRPEAVKTALGGIAQTAPSSAALASPPPASIEPERLRTVAPPRVRLRVVGVDAQRGSARIEVEAERSYARSPQMQDVAVYVNDIPVLSARERGVGWTERSKLRREFDVPLSQRWNDIRVETLTASSMGLASTKVQLPQTPQQPALGDLYVLAIGVNRFEQLGKTASLSFAAQDASAFAQTMTQSQASALSFRKRYMRVLSDQSGEKPTRANILSALAFIGEARANDTVVVFLASHGVADAAGNYYFVPSDAKAEHVREGEAVGDASSLLSWQVFFDALRSTAGRRLMVVDTCHAGGAVGRIEPTALIKRSASSNFALLLASGENERSQEYRAGGHGLFTYGLLRALREAAAKSSEPLTLDAWFNQTLPVVRRLRDPRGGPQTPQLLAPPVLRETVLAGV
jgi:hypothetical protein